MRDKHSPSYPVWAMIHRCVVYWRPRRYGRKKLRRQCGERPGLLERTEEVLGDEIK